jgi:ankyrin repeat protein
VSDPKISRGVVVVELILSKLNIANINQNSDMRSLSLSSFLFISILSFTTSSSSDSPLSENKLLSAVHSNDITSVKELILRQNYDPNTKEAQNGWTPLHIAANNGNVEIVEFLIQIGVKVDEADATGWTPLMTACYSRAMGVVKILLSSHLRPFQAQGQNQRRLPSSYSQQGIINSLVPAYLSGSEEVVQIISQTIQRSTLAPLFTTKHTQQNNGGRKRRTSSSLSTSSNEKISVLLTAAHSGTKHALQTILPLYDYEVNEERSLGDLTSLMLAASAGRPENIELLLSHGADRNLQDHRGWTALMFAVQSNCLSCIELLLTYSPPSPPSSSPAPAAPSVCQVELMNDSGHTASDIAERRGFPELGQEIFGIGYCNAVQRLDLEAILEITRVGGNPNIQCRTAGGYTPLILVTRLGDESAVKDLLDAAADPNLSEGNLWTPLMFAILRNSSHIVELLLDYGATVNSYSSSSSHASGPTSPLQLVKILLDQGQLSHEIVDMLHYASRLEIEQIMSPGALEFLPTDPTASIAGAAATASNSSPTIGGDPTTGPTFQRLRTVITSTSSFSSALSFSKFLPAPLSSFTEIIRSLFSSSTSSPSSSSTGHSSSTLAPRLNSTPSLSVESVSSWIQHQLSWSTTAPRNAAIPRNFRSSSHSSGSLGRNRGSRP